MADSKCRVLCVDDHHDTSEMLELLLAKEDYAVETAGTMEDACNLAEKKQFDLYVLDRRQQKIAILERKTLKILGHFGGGVGEDQGQFYVLHDMATDSHGNFYTAEINQNSRAQKFLFKGMSKAK